MRNAGIATVMCMLLVSGCASTVQQRGWVGGTFVEAERSFWCAYSGNAGKGISALPEQVAKNQKRAVFVSQVFPDTPAAKGDLHAGDLIVAVNGVPVKNLDHFRKTIRESREGALLDLNVFRDGKTQENKVAVGRESYREGGSFSIGLRLAPKLSLEPLEPGWSILGILSFKCRTTDPELLSPEWQYFRAVAPDTYCTPEGESYVPGRGWDLWLGVLGFGGEERILTQQSAAK